MWCKSEMTDMTLTTALSGMIFRRHGGTDVMSTHKATHTDNHS